MPRYRVFGTKYQNYYTHVSAADEYAAAEAANASPSGPKAGLTGVFTKPLVSDRIHMITKGSNTMATKREYLKTQGITVGLRGRFSSAAVKAISEAEAQGIKFEAEKKQAKK